MTEGTPDDRVFVRLVRGSVGGLHPEDGVLMLLPAEQAAALVDCGEAVRVTLPDPAIGAPGADVRDGDGKVTQTTTARPS